MRIPTQSGDDELEPQSTCTRGSIWTMMIFSAPLISVLRLEVISVPHSLVATTKVYLSMPAPGSTYLVYIMVGKVFRLLQAVPRGKCQGNFLPKQFISFIGQQTVRNFCDFELGDRFSAGHFVFLYIGCLLYASAHFHMTSKWR